MSWHYGDYSAVAPSQVDAEAGHWLQPHYCAALVGLELARKLLGVWSGLGKLSAIG